MIDDASRLGNEVAEGASRAAVASSVWRDRTLLVVVLFLMSGWGCLAIYHATMNGPQPLLWAGQQLLWLVVGMLVLVGAAAVPFRNWCRWLPGLATGAYLALVLVLVCGVSRHGVRGWFAVGDWLVQPAELAKPVFILWLCRQAQSPGPGTWWRMPVLAGIWLLPLMLQPDFGTAAIYAAAFCLVVVLAELRQVGLGLGAVLLAALMAVMISRHPYVLARFSGFLDPAADPFGKGWHLLQCQYALARGGGWGTGWDGALWTQAYLPLAHNDSAYAAMAEALGWFQCLPVVLAMPALAWFCVRRADQVAAPLAKLYVRAFAMTVAVQALVHLSVNVGLLPITGITMPCLSYGGSSMLATMLGFGILGSALAQRE